MATAAQLKTAIASELPDSLVQVVATFTTWRIDTDAAETVRWCRNGKPPDLTLSAGDRVINDGLALPEYQGSAVSIDTRGGRNVSIIQGQTSSDSMILRLRIPAMAVDDSGFADQAAQINGAVAAGAYSAAIDGLTASREIRRGHRFRVAAENGWSRWFVVLDDVTANASGQVATLRFWPAAPSGGFADDANIIEYEGGSSAFEPWRAHLFRGQAVTDVAVVGETEKDGRLAWASRITMWSGGVIDRAQFLPAADDTGDSFIELALRPPGLRWDRPVFREYNGLGLAPYADGAMYYNTSTARPTGIDPTAGGQIWGLVTTWVGEAMRGSAAVHPLIATGTLVADTGSWIFYFDGATMTFKVAISIASVLYTATGPVLGRLEAGLTTAAFFIDLTANTAQVYMHEHRDHTRPGAVTAGTVNSTLTGTYTATAQQTRLLADSNPTTPTNIADNIGVYQIAVGTTNPSTTAAIENLLRSGQLTLGSTASYGIQWIWPSGALSASPDGDQWIAVPQDPTTSPTSQAEATINATGTAQLGHALQGGTFLRGQGRHGGYGYIWNHPGNPTGSGVGAVTDKLLYSIGAGPFDAGYKDGAPFGAGTERADLETLLTTAPSAGTMDTAAGGARESHVRVDALAGTVTADCHGECLDDTALHATNAATSLVDLPSAISTMLGGAASTFMCWFFLDGYTTGYWTLFDNYDTVAGGGFQFKWDQETATSGAIAIDIGYQDTVPSVQVVAVDLPDMPLLIGRACHVAVVSQNTSGTTATVKFYLNWRLLHTENLTGQIGTSTLTMRVLNENTGVDVRASGAPFNASVNRIGVYNEALTVSQIWTAAMSDDPTADTTPPEHFYGSPTALQAVSSWIDTGATGGQNASLTAMTWREPIPMDCLPSIGQLLLRRAGQAAATSLDLEEAFDLPDDVRGVPLEPDATLGEALDKLRGPDGWFIGDPLTGKITWKSWPDLATATADYTLYESDGRLAVAIGAEIDPPWQVAVGYDPVGVVQTDVNASTTDDRRGLIGAPLRYEPREAGSSSAYPDSVPFLQLSGSYSGPNDGQGQAAAGASADRVVTRLASRMIEVEVSDFGWADVIPPASVVEVHHRRVPGGKMRGIAVAPQVSGGRRIVRIVGIPV